MASNLQAVDSVTILAGFRNTGYVLLRTSCLRSPLNRSIRTIFASAHVGHAVCQTSGKTERHSRRQLFSVCCLAHSHAGIVLPRQTYCRQDTCFKISQFLDVGVSRSCHRVFQATSYKKQPAGASQSTTVRCVIPLQAAHCYARPCCIQD